MVEYFGICKKKRFESNALNRIVFEGDLWKQYLELGYIDKWVILMDCSALFSMYRSIVFPENIKKINRIVFKEHIRAKIELVNRRRIKIESKRLMQDES